MAARARQAKSPPKEEQPLLAGASWPAWPATAIELRPLDELRPYHGNARQHPPAQIEQIAASMREFGFTIPVLVDETGLLIAGHGRVLAAQRLVAEGRAEFERVPVMVAAGWTDAQRRAYTIADNRLAETSTWDLELLRAEVGALQSLDFDMPSIGFDEAGLRGLFEEQSNRGGGQAGISGILLSQFMVAPFSVLNARDGWWQDRKRAWIALGLNSELGRGANALGFSDTILQYHAGNRPKARANAKPTGGGGGVWAAYNERQGTSGTSIFDPVLAEVVYRWFSPLLGIVLDPFAGGSVRGVVASKLGRHYHGIDLRPEQVAENEKQAAAICTSGADAKPHWIVGDSDAVLPAMKLAPADLLFSCPPYGDLEVYSELPEDLSTLDYGEFIRAYGRIIGKAVDRLADNRFACFVVGDFRDERGFYRNFVSDTIDAFEAAGARLYNEIILVIQAGSVPLRCGKSFSTTRKVGKTHQNVLVFCKGDPRKATEACGTVEIDESLFGEAAAAPADDFGPIIGGQI